MSLVASRSHKTGIPCNKFAVVELIIEWFLINLLRSQAEEEGLFTAPRPNYNNFLLIKHEAPASTLPALPSIALNSPCKHILVCCFLFRHGIPYDTNNYTAI